MVLGRVLSNIRRLAPHVRDIFVFPSNRSMKNPKVYMHMYPGHMTKLYFHSYFLPIRQLRQLSFQN